MEGRGKGEMSVDLRLELCALDKSSAPPAMTTEAPIWESVSEAIDRVFKNGGFVYLKVIRPCGAFIDELCMKSLPGQYRLIVSTRSSDPKAEIQEWWEEGDSTFRGTVRFGDDEWDARTVCSDIDVAKKIFRELYDSGELALGMRQMRSQWEPKP